MILMNKKMPLKHENTKSHERNRQLAVGKIANCQLPIANCFCGKTN